MRKFRIALLLYVVAFTIAAFAQEGAQGSLTASTTDCTISNSCVSLPFRSRSNTGAATIELSGIWVGTVQFEARAGSQWVAISATQSNSSTTVTSATGNGTWQVNVAGYGAIRARCSAFTSGTIAVTVSTAIVSARLGGGGGAVFASGGTTNNVIPKSNGSSVLVDSAASEDGTSFISGKPVTVPTVSTTSTAIRGAADSTTGIAFNTARLDLNISSVSVVDIQPGNVIFGSDNSTQLSNAGLRLKNIFTVLDTVQGASGEQWIRGSNSELLTLSTGGTTTDTAGNLLPANSIIESVVARVTTTITTATNWELGDATQAARFSSPNSTLTSGTTQVGLNQADPTVASANLGPVQVAAAKVRVTTTGTPGAGAIRITVFYRQFVPPTS